MKSKILILLLYAFFYVTFATSALPCKDKNAGKGKFNNELKKMNNI
jgi:hypothetical protein